MATPIQSICSKRNCRHYAGIIGPTIDPVHYCTAFPRGIPDDILTGKNLHKNPYPDDDGIRYENKEGNA